jgi:hypothetical protein
LSEKSRAFSRRENIPREIPPNRKSPHLRKDAEVVYLQAFSEVWQKAMMRKSPLNADLKRYFLN